MGSVRVLDTLSSEREPVAAPVLIQFTPPASVPVPPTPRAARRTTPKASATTPPVAVPTTIAAPDPAIAVTPAVPAAPARDSGATAPAIDATARPSILGLITTRVVPSYPDAAPRRAGAAISRAGVTSPSGTLTVVGRDSIMTEKMKGVVAEALSRPMTKEEKAEVAANSEPGRALPGTRAAGDAPLMNGGANVRIPLGSFTLPLFTRKPSPVETREQRELRLRLQDRAIFLRDSLRKDSLEKARIRP
jgi:hypothetical protein